MMPRLVALALALTTVGTGAAAKPRTVLFIGNSFTYAANSPVRNWHADRVTDLNHAGFGGVPALFKAFADESGLDYDVSLETQGGQSLAFHYAERRALFDRAWDVVVLQEYSTLDSERPGDPARYLQSVGQLASLFRARNPKVQIQLMSTWTRADQTYRPGGHWYGRPIGAMAGDLRRAAELAKKRTNGVTGILPVGQAWNRAFASKVADPNPYDGITFGQIDLWSYDQYHASTAGYYLEALVTFGAITGIDPVKLGLGEKAADELGLSREQAAALQKVARDELATAPGNR
jgi:hypothetical protein